MQDQYKFKKIDQGTYEVLLQDPDGSWNMITTVTGRSGAWMIGPASSRKDLYATREDAARAFANTIKRDLHIKNSEVRHWWWGKRFSEDQISEELAEKIFSLLQEHFAVHEQQRSQFIHHHVHTEHISTEYRFSGNIGFGGKFRNHTGWWVDCYTEEETCTTLTQILVVNRKLRDLWKEAYEEEG